MPMTLSDSIACASTATLMRADAGIANRGSTLPSFDRASSSLKVWPDPSKNFSAVGGIQRDGDLLPQRFVERRIRDRQRRHETRQLRPIPRNVLPFRVLNRQHADRAGTLRGTPSVSTDSGPAAGPARSTVRRSNASRSCPSDRGPRDRRASPRAPAGRSRQRRSALRQQAPARCASRRSLRRPAPPASRRRRCARATGSTAPRRCGGSGSGTGWK